MAADCVFCGIVDGEVPSRSVYETDRVLAFLDVNPLTRGHTLVVPKAHHSRLKDLPTDVAGSLFEAVQALLTGVESAVDADATTLAVNDGPAAGQEVPHVHVHLVPRRSGDDGGPIHAAFGSRPSLTEAEFDAIADRVSAAVGG